MSLAPMPGRPRVAPQTGPFVWTGPEIGPADWMIPVGAEDAAELDAALAALGGRAPDSAAEVELPRLGPVLSDLVARLEHGRGFALLRGLPFDRHGPEAAEAALLALGTHLGTPLVLGGGPAVGRLVGPVEGPAAAGGPPRFHSDSCDAVALLCLRNAPDSPPHVLVSAGAVHNALLKHDRTALDALYRPVPLAEGETVVERAVFTAAGGAFSGRYTRAAVEAAARHPGAAPLPEALGRALDLLDEVCADPALSLRLETRPGDLLCFNPHLVWKRRTLSEAGVEAPQAPQEFRRLRLTMSNSRSGPDGEAEAG